MTSRGFDQIRANAEQEVAENDLHCTRLACILESRAFQMIGVDCEEGLMTGASEAPWGSRDKLGAACP